MTHIQHMAQKNDGGPGAVHDGGMGARTTANGRWWLVSGTVTVATVICGMWKDQNRKLKQGSAGGGHESKRASRELRTTFLIRFQFHPLIPLRTDQTCRIHTKNPRGGTELSTKSLNSTIATERR